MVISENFGLMMALEVQRYYNSSSGEHDIKISQQLSRHFTLSAVSVAKN